MSRLAEHADQRPGLFARLVYFIARRKLGHVPQPLKVLVGNGALMMGVGAFETALDKSTYLPERTKSLAQIHVAMLVGCPF